MRVKSVDYRPMTPAEVFQTLEAARHFVASQWGDPDETLAPDMTVLAWCSAYEDFAWGLRKNLAVHLNDLFGLSLKWSEWRTVLKPERQRTVWDVCEFIAERAQIPCIRPVPVLGVPCRSAGAFHALHHMLAAAGRDVSRLKPSMVLDADFDAQFGALCRLAPLLGNTRLAPHIPKPGPLRAAGCVLLIGGVVLAMLVSWPAGFVAWGLGLALFAGESLRDRGKPRDTADDRLFTDYATVGDFCRAMAAHAADEPPSPPV